MTDATPDPWTRWREMAARLFPKLGRRDAVPESEVTAAEARLGVRLPARLRELYRLSGRRRDLHATHDRLFATNKLILVPPSSPKGVLVFYEQQDSAAAWGIAREHLGKDLGKDDPPVVRALNRPPYVWEPDHDTLSSFFFTELLWQHVNATPNAAIDASASTLDAIAKRFDPIALEGCRWDVEGCWGRDGTVLLARGRTQDHIRLYVGTTSAEALASTLAELGLENSDSIPAA
jgi:hypothetical protein